MFGGVWCVRAGENRGQYPVSSEDAYDMGRAHVYYTMLTSFRLGEGCEQEKPMKVVDEAAGCEGCLRTSQR